MTRRIPYIILAVVLLCSGNFNQAQSPKPRFGRPNLDVGTDGSNPSQSQHPETPERPAPISIELRELTADDIPKKWRDGLFLVEDGEVAIKGKFIKRIELGKTSASISLANKTEVSIRPSIGIKVLNRYGYELGMCSISWALDTVRAGETHVEQTSWSYDTEGRFEFTGAKLPKDFFNPHWIIVKSAVL